MFTASALLAVAIAIEVAATSMLQRTEGFSQPLWTGVVLGGYGVSIWLLTVVVRQIPVSVTYAVWSGAGTALVALVGAAWLGESLSPVKLAALALIIGGVVLLHAAPGSTAA